MKRKSKDDFILEARSVHGNLYDYSNVEYTNCDTKVSIICPEHGEFWQTPYSHIKRKQGCPKCVGKEKSTNDFINQAKEVHKDKYDYSKVIYVNAYSPITLICPEHGEFIQTPHNHLCGYGCAKCAKNVKLSTNEFVELAKEIHGDLYDYSKVEYINSKTPVCIIYQKHGEFWQTPQNHIYKKQNCPHCNIQSHLEQDIENYLSSNNIRYKKEHTFDWLQYKWYMRLDFFLPDHNIAIECQGEQHFRPVKYFGGEKYFELVKIRDSIKQKLCDEHGIKIIYFTNIKMKEYPYPTTITDISKLKYLLYL